MKLCLFPTVEAPAEARQGISPLAERIDSTSYSDLRTVVSELVTIAVSHGATEAIDLSLDLGEAGVEGVVYDHGAGTRAIVRARQGRESCLALRIIDSLVDEWGTDPEETRVWFKLPIH